MNKLWIYGDSFAVDFNVDWQWHRQLAKNLNCDLTVNGVFGVANDWILLTLSHDILANNIQPEDSVVVIISDPSRYWFLEQHPSISNYHNTTHLHKYQSRHGVNNEQIKSIELYYKHIQKDFVDAFRYDAHISWLNHTSQELKKSNIRFCAISGFDIQGFIPLQSQIPITGSLVNAISSPEFTSEHDELAWYDQGVPDQRLNHMLKDNHQILAEHLYQGIVTEQGVDLNTVAWAKHVLNMQTRDQLIDQLSPLQIR